MPSRHLPIVGIPACVKTIDERVLHTVNEKYLNAVIEAACCLPILIPAVGPRIEPRRIIDMLDGLLLTGSPSNVHPSEYGCAPDHHETLHDPARDATTLPLIREAVRRDLPILAICRGLQELNVALGGTLHQRVDEVPGRLNHRPHRDSPEGPYGPAHAIALTPGGLLFGLAGGAEQVVNSLHSQGIDRPAAELRVEAVAPDGQIEAAALPGARFVVGVQWHPEYRHRENPFSSALFAAFSQACSATRAGFIETARAA
jgi:putative glutamine amidotransferase